MLNFANFIGVVDEKNHFLQTNFQKTPSEKKCSQLFVCKSKNVGYLVESITASTSVNIITKTIPNNMASAPTPGYEHKSLVIITGVLLDYLLISIELIFHLTYIQSQNICRCVAGNRKSHRPRNSRRSRGLSAVQQGMHSQQ